MTELSEILTKHTSMSFARLFKRYRLLSGIATLDEFADELAKEGIYLESSIFSHWQIGDRAPTNRGLVLRVVHIFVTHEAIRNVEEANEFLATTEFGYLTSIERNKIFPKKDPEISVEEKVKKIQTTETLSKYFLDFLQQAQRGNFSYYSEIETELTSIRKVLRECIEYKFYLRYLQIWNYVSPFFWDRGYWDEFESLSKKAFGIATLLDNKQEMVRCLVEDLSWLYYWRGEITKMEQTLAKSEKIVLSNDDLDLTNLYFLRKSLILNKKHRFDEAKSLLSKANSFFSKQHDENLTSKSYLYLGHVFQEKGDFTKAKRCYELSLGKGKLTNNENESKALYYLGETNVKTGQILTAKHYFSTALKINQKDKRLAGLAWNHYGLALCTGGTERKQLAFTAGKLFSSLKMQQQAHKSVLITQS